MAKAVISISSKQESALALALEYEPKKWGADQHLAFLRYLVLQCSNASKAMLKDGKLVMPDGKPLPEKIEVSWADLRSEMQLGKLAECANFYKWLQESGNMEKVEPEKKVSEYA